MARNIDYGEAKNLIPFNCYKSTKNENGRLIRETIAYDRIWCSEENTNIVGKNINNVFRSKSEDCTFKTTSANTLQQDYYIENQYTKEMWKIESISKMPVNNEGYENSCRISYETTISCTKLYAK